MSDNLSLIRNVFGAEFGECMNGIENACISRIAMHAASLSQHDEIAFRHGAHMLADALTMEIDRIEAQSSADEMRAESDEAGKRAYDAGVLAIRPVNRALAILREADATGALAAVGG